LLAILAAIAVEGGKTRTGGHWGWAAVGLVLFALLAGCGETVVDQAKLEDTLRENVEKQQQKKVAEVECPSDQEVKPKATFRCTIELKDGKTETATLEIRNDQADVSVVGLEEGSGSAR
jgi:uncharacterized protein DUF4333